jgi:hypothetical protein
VEFSARWCPQFSPGKRALNIAKSFIIKQLPSLDSLENRPRRKGAGV